MPHRLSANFLKVNSPKRTGALAGLLILCIILAGIYLQVKIISQNNTIAALQDLSIVRADLESCFNTRLLLSQGLVSYVQVNPDIQADEFQTFAAGLIGSDPLVKNISLIKDTTILYVYPAAGNQAAIGRGLSQIAEQRETVMQAIVSRKPVITGIVKLVQGGQAVIFRIPIFIKSSSAEQYWGQASVVLDADRLFTLTRFHSQARLASLSLYNTSSSGQPTTLIYGAADTLDRQHVSTEVLLPNGKWHLAAVPVSISPWRSPAILWLLFAGLLVAAAGGWFAGYFIYLKNILRQMAYSDSLTKLPNRLTLNEYLSRQKKTPPGQDARVGVLMIDIDRFKEVNDQYGHQIGDLLLKEFAGRLVAAVREADTIIRLGGDEFLLLMAGVKNHQDLELMAEKIRRLYDQPFLLDGRSVAISAAVGFALYPDDSADMDSVIHKADEGMYQDKNEA